jgi:hypothetical protein
MKFFTKSNVNIAHRSHKYPTDVALSLGRIVTQKDVSTININEMGIQVQSFHRVNEKNGWYFRFESPFAKTITYTCPIDYVEKTGKCRATWLFTWRKNKVNKTDYVKTFAWIPLEMVE